MDLVMLFEIDDTQHTITIPSAIGGEIDDPALVWYHGDAASASLPNIQHIVDALNEYFTSHELEYVAGWSDYRDIEIDPEAYQFSPTTQHTLTVEYADADISGEIIISYGESSRSTGILPLYQLPRAIRNMMSVDDGGIIFDDIAVPIYFGISFLDEDQNWIENSGLGSNTLSYSDNTNHPFVDAVYSVFDLEIMPLNNLIGENEHGEAMLDGLNLPDGITPITAAIKLYDQDMNAINISSSNYFYNNQENQYVRLDNQISITGTAQATLEYWIHGGSGSSAFPANLTLTGTKGVFKVKRGMPVNELPQFVEREINGETCYLINDMFPWTMELDFPAKEYRRTMELLEL